MSKYDEDVGKRKVLVDSPGEDFFNVPRKKKKKWNLFQIAFLVSVVFGLLLVVYIIIGAFYGSLFADQECTIEQRMLDDLAYMDDGNLIFYFGDERIIATPGKDSYFIGETLTIEKCEDVVWPGGFKIIFGGITVR